MRAFSVQSFGEAPATHDLPIPVLAAAAHPNATPDSVATAVVLPGTHTASAPVHGTYVVREGSGT